MITIKKFEKVEHVNGAKKALARSMTLDEYAEWILEKDADE